MSLLISRISEQSEQNIESVSTQECISTIQQTTEFHDAGVTDTYTEKSSYYESQDYKNQAPLSEYLARPIRLYSFTWTEVEPIKNIRAFEPFQVFISNPSIKNKITNFAFIRFDLKIRIITNASPFYYGALIIAWQPLQNFKPLTIVSTSSNLDLIPFSQLPHVWLYPQENTSAEMTLPFICPVNYLRTGVVNDFRDMGTLKIINYTTLQSANDAVGTGVTVQLFGWAENVKLVGPTNGLVLQGDEYSQGPISKVASAVSSAASYLTKIPIIGKFAKATEIGASAIGRISGLFGFTNVPQLGPIENFRPVAFPPMATVDNVFGLDKLTVDSKNELTIDPRVFGDDGSENLSVRKFCEKESYIQSFIWHTTDSVDTLLCSAATHPTLRQFTGYGDGYTLQIYTCPMAYMSQLFSFWRGDLIFRFVIVASKFHKGRLRFVYDPYGDATHDASTEDGSGAVVISQLFDLGVSNEFEVRIPYQQPTEWSKVPNLDTGHYFFGPSTTAVHHTPYYTNGAWSIKVQTNLTAPVATSNVSVLVFVRGAENLEFAGPANTIEDALNRRVSFLAPQGEVIEAEINKEQEPTENTYLLYMGEKLASAAALTKRMTLHSVLPAILIDPEIITLTRFNFSLFPTCPGYYPDGQCQVAGVQVPGSFFPYNACMWTPLTWLTNCFLARRGSINMSINSDPQGTTTSLPGFLRIIRQPKQTYSYTTSTYTSTVSTETSHQGMFYVNSEGGISGQTITNVNLQPNLSVNLPYYSNTKFSSTDPALSTHASSSTWADQEMNYFTAEITGNNTNTTSLAPQLQISMGAGPDFSVGFFLNTPTVFNYATPVFPGL